MGSRRGLISPVMITGNRSMGRKTSGRSRSILRCCLAMTRAVLGMLRLLGGEASSREGEVDAVKAGPDQLDCLDAARVGAQGGDDVGRGRGRVGREDGHRRGLDAR